MDSGIDAETRGQLLEGVRRFVRERLRPMEAAVAEADEVPADIVQEMRELGLFGLSVPQEFGGLGLSMEDEVLVCLELGQTSLAFRSVFGTNRRFIPEQRSG
jgi:acyl-CoA dehydrogenase